MPGNIENNTVVSANNDDSDSNKSVDQDWRTRQSKDNLSKLQF